MHPAPSKDDAPRRRDFSQVDVFTATGLLGNPVAVVRDGRGLGSEDPVTGHLNADLAHWLIVVAGVEGAVLL